MAETITPLQPKNGRPAIRMFCHALGDCFLIALPHGDEVSYLGVDCGAIIGTPQSGERMDEVARALAASCEQKLSHLFVTHEHWDHVSGFLDAEATWRTIKVEELHYAWTEDPKDELANQIRDQRERAAEITLKAFGLMEGEQRSRALGLMGFLGVDQDNLKVGKTRQALMKPLEMYAGKPVHYWLPGQSVQVTPDIRLLVLGPPRDAAALKQTNRKREQYGLGMNEVLLSGMEQMFGMFTGGADPDVHGRAGTPFQRVGIAVEKLREAPDDFPEAKELFQTYEAETWRRIDSDWLGSVEHLALAMDSATNNTSLVFALHLQQTDEYLLFVGDAQAGNWLSWGERTYKAIVGGIEREVSIDEIFSKTIFYKVGHHGSHNATMSHRGLEKMTSGRLSAMIPVDTYIAHEKKGWVDMPLPSIVERLRQLTGGRVMQLDDKDSPCPPGFSRGPHSTLFDRQTYLDLDV